MGDQPRDFQGFVGMSRDLTFIWGGNENFGKFQTAMPNYIQIRLVFTDIWQFCPNCVRTFQPTVIDIVRGIAFHRNMMTFIKVFLILDMLNNWQDKAEDGMAKLPLPEVESTLAKYLDCIEAFVDKESHQRNSLLVKEFLAKPDVITKVNQHLLERLVFYVNCFSMLCKAVL